MLKFQIPGMTEIHSADCTVRPERTLQPALPATIPGSERRLVPMTIVDEVSGSPLPDSVENGVEAAGPPLGAAPTGISGSGVIVTAPRPVHHPERRGEIRP